MLHYEKSIETFFIGVRSDAIAKKGGISQSIAWRWMSRLNETIARSHRTGLPLTKSCDLFEFAKCSYYPRLVGPGLRVQKDQALGERIKRIHAAHDERYGILRMTAALKKDGHERKPGHTQ